MENVNQKSAPTVSATKPAINPVCADETEILQEYQTDIDQGLDKSQVLSRQEKYGPNELESAPPTPKWRIFLQQFNSPLIFLLFAAIAISLVAWILDGSTGVPIDAIVITAIVVFNAVMGYFQENKAADAVAALQSMTQSMATVIRAGEQILVPAAELVPGDLLVLAEGDEIGADARLISASSLQVAEASLTGESVPVDKTLGTLSADTPLGDRTNMVFKGTAVTQGVGQAIVTAIGMDTEMGAIATMLSETKSEPTPLTKEINQLGKILGVSVIAIALVVMTVMYAMADEHSFAKLVEVLILGVSLAVAAVPEGLPAILTMVLSLGVQRMAKRNAIVKDLSSVETLGSSSVIASDKTGTLTRNEMTILKIITSSGETNLEGVGYEPKGDIYAANGEQLTPEQLYEVSMTVSAGAAANNAKLSYVDNKWQIQGDPTEAAFIVADGKLGDEATLDEEFERSGEVPFTSARKMMSVVGEAEGYGPIMFAKGAPDVLLANCSKRQVGQEIVELDQKARDEILHTVEELAADAFRTMGVGYRTLPTDPGSEVDESWEEQLVFLGVVAIIDPPRSEASESIAQAHQAGIRVMMITGDHPATAGRIAADLGIIAPGDKVVTGAQLDALDEQQLDETTSQTCVYARVAPKHKLQIVASLQNQGHIVSMTGDGVNDAPALKAADIGVAMGITGTQVTKESAKMILADDDFSTIVAAVREGRQIFANISKFLRYLLSSNIGEVLTMFFGIALASIIGLYYTDPGTNLVHFQVPLLATQILWINLVTDSLPALAMGVDPAVEDMMNKKPRKLTDPVINRGAWIDIIWVGFLMAVGVLFVLDFYMPNGLVTAPNLSIDGAHDLPYAQTAAFTTLVLMQLINTFNSRSQTESAFKSMFSNVWIWVSILLGVGLQLVVVYLPFMQVGFKTAPMSLSQWVVCLLVSSSILIIEEIRKLILRNIQARKSVSK